MQLKLNELIRIYINEKSTKRLLPYNEIADEFSEIVKNRNENLDNLKIIRSLQELELQRLKYFVKEYILVRLEKIKSNIFLSEELMSDREKKFYKKYISLLNDQNVLTTESSIEFEYVGFYCINGLKNIKIDGEVIEVSEGDFLVANLAEIIDYVISGNVVLV